MAIDLSSRLSAITVDSAGVTHVVWVEGQQILHAKYDANAQEWVDTQVIASGLFTNVTSLNLLADPELISTSNSQIPGLAVIYQQGSDNESEFFYSAAKYDQNQNLQWLETPVQLTDNESGDLQPRSILQGNQVNVVGQKINLESAAQQSIRDDSDLYFQKFTVEDSQFTSTITNTPPAPYSPNTETDGVITGYSNNTSSQNSKNVATTAKYNPVTGKEASNIVTKSDFQGWGWNFDVSQKFSTDVLQDWGLIKTVPNPFHGLFSQLFDFSLTGILLGDYGLPNFDQLDISGDLILAEKKKQSAATTAVKQASPVNTELAVSVDWGGSYSFGIPNPVTPGQSYPFLSQNSSLGLSVELKETFNLVPDVVKASLFGSAGMQVIATLTPTDPNYQPPFFAGIKDYNTALGTFVALPPVGAPFAIAEAVGATIEDIIGGTNGDLQLQDIFIGLPVSAGVSGEVELPFVLKLGLTGQITVTPFVDIIKEPSNAVDVGAILGFPISAEAKLLGFIKVGTSINPQFRWDSNYPTVSSSNPSNTTNNSKTAKQVTEATEDSPTAIVNGSLLTLDFGTSLNQNNIPNPSQFTVNVLDYQGNPITDPQTKQPETIAVYGVVVTDSGVILQLNEPFVSGGAGNANDQIQVNYTLSSNSENNLEDNNNNQISSFDDLAVTNNSSDSIVYTFNPVGGTNQDYSTEEIQSVVPGVAEDFAEDSPPALSAISSEQILLAWSSSTPTLTPIEAVVNGRQILLNFATEIGTPQNALAANQFTVTQNGTQVSVSVNTINDNTVVLELPSSANPQDQFTISYQPSSTVANNKNLYFTNGAQATLYVPAFDNLEATNTTGITTAPVLLAAQAVEDQIRLIFNQVLDDTFIPDINQFVIAVNNQAGFSLTGAVQVNNNVVTLNVQAAAGQQPIIRQGDLVNIDYSLDTSESSNNLTNVSGVAVGAFSNQIVTTSPSAPSSVINTAFSPFGNAEISNPISIIGSDGINYAPAAAQDQNNKSVVVWAHGDVAELSEKLLPGEIYEDNDVIEINNALEATDIYYSVLGANNNWSVAAPIATNQPGTDSQVTLGKGPNGQLMGAWLNTQTESNGDSQTTIYYSLWNGSAWSSPQTILSEVEPDPATELSISTINNQPAIFWTETQPTAYAGLVVQSNPLIYLRLGETSGTTGVNFGQIGGAANGTYSGSYTLNQTGALVGNTSNPGDPNPAVVFSNGGNLTTPAFGYSGNSFSVEFWFKAPNLTTANLVSAAGLFNFNLSSTNLTFSAPGGSVTTSKDGQNQPLKSNQWYYVVGTYDGDSKTMSLYLNGQQVATLDNVTLTPSTDSYSLTLGGSSASVYLDEVAFYDQVLNNNTTSIESIQNNPQDITGTQLQELLTQPIGINDKYDARFTKPLPPGADTNYSVWNGTTWEQPAEIEPTALIVPTQLADARNPVWDIVSPTNIEPNGNSDVYFPLTVSNQQNREITGITITDSSGKVIASTQANNLAVTQNNQVLNVSGSFTHNILGETEEFGLYLDNGNGNGSNTKGNIQVTFSNGNTSTLTNQVSVDSSSVVADIENPTVLATATVTEANDSSLALIDSGFIIDTANNFVGTVLAKGQLGTTNPVPYVAVYNSGYQAQQNQGQNGTVQVLIGTTNGLLGNNGTEPLSNTNVTTNPAGILITGIPDVGLANGDFPGSLATGDLNGDGYDELIIGTPNANNNQGAVYVILGSYLNSNPNTTINLSSLTSTQGYKISLGAKPGDLAGFALATGNFNSNSKLDLIIGAPNTNNGAGAVYVVSDGGTTATSIYSGKSYQIQDPANPQDSTATITVGEQAGYALGVSRSISSNSPFASGGGSDNLIIGAPGYLAKVNNNWQGADALPTDNLDYPSNSQVQVGAAYIYTSNGGSFSSYATLTGANLTPASGTAENTRFGSAITSDDWNGDNRNDLAIAAIGSNAGTGIVYALKGGSLGSSPSAKAINQVTNLQINGGIANGEAGSVIASPGDLNQDNYNDLLITAPDSANGAGQSYLMFGGQEIFSDTEYDLNPTATTNKADLLLNGSNPNDQAGVAATPVGDVNNDQIDDLMISAPGTEEMYVVYGHPWLADDGSIKLADISSDNGFVIDGDDYSTLGANNGEEVVLLGDINGDGFADVLSGSDNAAVIIFGASTKDVVDASAGSDDLIVKLSSGGNIRQFLSLGDFNGDGLQDFGLVGANNTFYLVLGNTNLSSLGSLTISTSLPHTNFINNAVAVQDYNGDGYDDVLLLGSNGNKIFSGNPQGNLSSSETFNVNENAVVAGIGDNNGDNYADVVIGNKELETSTSVGDAYGTFNDLEVVLGNSSSSSGNSTQILQPSDTPFQGTLNGRQVNSAGDFNGDGIEDSFFSYSQAFEFMAWKGENQNNIFTASFNPNTGTWSNQTEQSFATPTSPSLAAVDENLYMAWQGTSQNNIFTASFNPNTGTWSNQTEQSFATPTSPSLAAVDGNLYMAWQGTSQNNIFTASFNSSTGTWSNQTEQSFATTTSPSLAAVNGTLYMAWKGTSQNNIFTASFNPNTGTWSNQTEQSFATTTSPSLAAVNGTLYMAWKGTSQNNIFTASFNPTTGTWSNQTQQFFATDIVGSPSLTALNGKLSMSWQGTSENNIFTASFDPTTGIWSNQTEQSFATTTSPTITPGALSGAVSILLGSNSSTPNFSSQISIQGPSFGGSSTYNTGTASLGTDITYIGDINGDGFDDVLINQPAYDDNTGVLYVVFGSESLDTIDLENLSDDQGFAIQGLPDSQAGISLSGGEDVNGDGFEDFMIGAPGDDDNLTYVLFGSDFTQQVNQTGTIGDDVILGSATGENIVTGQGDDEIYTNGGIDVVYAGPDEDLVTVSDTNFRRLDGGAGTDILQFTGETDQDWNLTQLSPEVRLRNFEILDLTGYGSNTLTLNSLTVNALSSNNTLTLEMDSEDKLSLSSDLVSKGIIYQNGTNYYKYQSNNTAAVVLVNASVGSGFTPSFTASKINTPSPIASAEANTTQASKANSPSETKQPKALVKQTPTTLPQPTRIHVTNPVASEAEKEIIFKFQRSGNIAGYAVVKYSSQDGRAKAGNDYQPVTGNLVFTPGEGDITVSVPLLPDEIFTGTRKFNLEVTLSSEPKALKGTPAPNTLKGTDGDDYIIGYQSRDILTGSAGNDVFGYTSIVEAGDIITDFKVGNDLIDLSAVLKNVGFTGLNGISKGYVGFKASGANTIVTLDADGPSGSGTARPFALVQNVSVGQLNNPSNFIFI